MASAKTSIATLQRQLHSQSARINPWFVSQIASSHQCDHPVVNQELKPTDTSQLPDEVPSYLKTLHSVLRTSPFLDTSQLLVCKPLPLGNGPGLPRRRVHGARRKRRQTFGGQGIEQNHSLWNWAVYAQVKEGTEGRGAIEAVLKMVRSTLQKVEPTLLIPRNRKQPTEEGWVMLDVGDVAIHVLSRAARERYFGSEQWD